MTKSNLHFVSYLIFFMTTVVISACKSEKEKIIIGKWTGVLHKGCKENTDTIHDQKVWFEFNKDDMSTSDNEPFNGLPFIYAINGDTLNLKSGIETKSYSMYIDLITRQYLRLTENENGCVTKIELVKI